MVDPDYETQAKTNCDCKVVYVQDVAYALQYKEYTMSVIG